jgi:uncharacterized protein YbjT (DUF2867 family)
MRIAIAGATGTVGRHILQTARGRGHEVVALSRSSGQDVSTGAGLVEAIAGTDAVIDVTNVLTTSASKSRQFFTRSTRNLLAAERSAGVGHHVLLSIVGIGDTDAGYYAGKRAQEREVSTGAVPWTIQRTTQFHEFAGQVVQRATFGPVVLIPTMRIRPVAAREVAERLVEVAEAGPAGRLADLVGPADERLIDMVRRLHARDGVTARLFEVRLPGRYWRAAASGSLRGNATESDLARTTFDQWLDGRVT